MNQLLVRMNLSATGSVVRYFGKSGHFAGYALAYEWADDAYLDFGRSSTSSSRSSSSVVAKWIAAEGMDQLATVVEDAYGRMIGLALNHLAVDGCITKASCGGALSLARSGKVCVSQRLICFVGFRAGGEGRRRLDRRRFATIVQGQRDSIRSISHINRHAALPPVRYGPHGFPELFPGYTQGDIHKRRQHEMPSACPIRKRLPVLRSIASVDENMGPFSTDD